MPNPTPTQLSAAFQACAAIAEAIRELNEVPSGTLYATLMGRMDFEAYTKVIGILKGAGLVAERASLLTWIGPEIRKGREV